MCLHLLASPLFDASITAVAGVSSVASISAVPDISHVD